MVRILQCVNNMHRAGLETMLMNYYRNIDRTKLQFDFLTHRKDRAAYDDEIEQLGGRIYRAPRLYPQNYPAYFSYMRAFFAEHPEYKIMHAHIDSMSYLPLLAGKHAAVPVRIAHSHNTSIDRDLKYPLKQFFRYRLPTAATHRFACGEEAGQFLFRGEDFKVIPNAVDAARFRYDPAVRRDMREALQLHGKVAVGHVGRFAYAKNHKFILEIFHAFWKSQPNAVLVLVGTGEKEQEMKERAVALGLEKQVLFLGSRSDVHALYQAMDVFLMPSLFEGVPVVGIEAQISGLPCLFSDAVPEEVAFSPKSRFLSLGQSAQQWAQAVAEAVQQERDGDVYVPDKYDVQRAAIHLQQQYLDLQECLGK